MPKFDASNPRTIHKSLADKSMQVQEAFCKAANAASDKGMNITLSVKQGLLAAEEVLAREEKQKQEELLLKVLYKVHYEMLVQLMVCFILMQVKLQ